MRADLLNAQASVDWPVSQLPSFRDRVSSWLNANIYVSYEDPDPNVENLVVVAVERELFPLAFMVEAGAYLNAIRSSLDILACALGARYGIPKADEASFPVAQSEAAFASGKYKGAEFLKALPESERAKIEALRPYAGGNDFLWTLHRLDITRKHKRLIEPAIRPQSIVVSGWTTDLDEDAFTPVLHGHVGVHDKTVIGLLSKTLGDRVTVRCTPFIAFNEPTLVRYKPAVAAIKEFADCATSIITLFDAP